MIDLSEFLSFIEENFQFMCGVPCSYFKDFLAYLSFNETKTPLKHILATREDEAIGIASGVSLSGKNALLYMQNSGIGNIGDALTSLAQLYKLPMLILVSYRGLESDNDFPEHSIMGEINEPLLKTLRIPYWDLTIENWRTQMMTAIQRMKEISSPVVLLVKNGVLSQ
ncbi:MAG: thiamine pyrophosphate-binding protein [Candidatus Hodarchaeales archaeon]|jgi:phosphonopyruvate decarboxylase